MIIYKYPLPLIANVPQSFEIPSGAIPLTVQLQDGMPALWMIVETWELLRTYRFIAQWTGEAFNDAGRYLGTCQTCDGTVWHFFMLED